MPRSAPIAGRRARKPTQDHQKFYNTQRWRKLSKAYRRENPLCEMCRLEGKVMQAQHVDHIIEVEARPDLGYDWNNLRGLCRRCHNRRHERGGA